MSVNYLRLVPMDPLFVPVAVDQQHILGMLKRFFPASDDIMIVYSYEVRFWDPGENLSRISCPLCRQEVSRDWWMDAMANAYERRFHDLAVTLPCCRGTTSLNELRYEWPAGFARFCLEVKSPGIGNWEDIAISSLEAALGFPLRAILAHY